MISGNLSGMRGYKGPNIAIVSACATGNRHCIGEAARMIEYGDADIMIAGVVPNPPFHPGCGWLLCCPSLVNTQ